MSKKSEKFITCTTYKDIQIDDELKDGWVFELRIYPLLPLCWIRDWLKKKPEIVIPTSPPPQTEDNDIPF